MIGLKEQCGDWLLFFPSLAHIACQCVCVLCGEGESKFL